jgi:heme ABC exporter ATP-binding subunit CcmA
MDAVMSQAIELCGAVAFAGSFPLLAGVDLSISSGEVVLLSGANGAGKTSLLRVLAGLIPVASGSIQVLGYDLLVERRSVRTEVGLVGHQSFLYEDLSAYENLQFWLRRPAVKVVEAALDRVGLTGRLARTPIARLSTGQRRRAVLALLIARSPRLWLLDEPHAGLDADGRALLDGLITEVQQAGATVVISSHEIGHVGSLATRTVSMSGGRISSPESGDGTEGDHDVS